MTALLLLRGWVTLEGVAMVDGKQKPAHLKGLPNREEGHGSLSIASAKGGGCGYSDD